MQREIFEVYAKIVDANGSYNTLTGYPKTFDSKNYDNDIEKTLQRAYGEWHEALGAMCKVDSRQLQFAMIIRASTGQQIECQRIGALAELPDPEPTPTPDVEQEG